MPSCRAILNKAVHKGAISANDKKKIERNLCTWIPVTERLPGKYDKVLITDEDGDIYTAHYIHYEYEDETIEWWSHDFVVYPTAWMPLPEPYREEATNAQLD